MTNTAMNSARLARQTAERLIGSRAALQRTPALVGFDGFVDHIYHAVEKRKSATEFDRMKSLKNLGKLATEAAGKSAALELVAQETRHGGNGPIMAFALSSLGVPVTYVGMTGHPKTHPIFAEFAKRATVHGITDPAETDAIEFLDGKLMLGKHATVADVTYETIKKRLGESNWKKLWESSRFVAMVNWTMLPHMTAIWKKIQSDFTPKTKKKEQTAEKSSSPRKQMFFDLCDPAKRSEQDVRTALETIAKFQEHHDVTLGLNESEGLQVAQVLGVSASGKGQKMITALAAKIREKLGIHCCVIHPIEYAVAANENEAVAVAGPYTKQPKISTGAGDHFNAGFCIARLLGCDLAQSLQLGVATSGFYVRQAISPSREQLVRFLQTL
jgi:sugar/nucleoside kinase (ribokinase family)